MSVRVTFTFGRLNPNPQKPTIDEALRLKLGREPSHHELVADVERILEESLVRRAEAGKLAHQRKRLP